jgi:hypothetical protein
LIISIIFLILIDFFYTICETRGKELNCPICGHMLKSVEIVFNENQEARREVKWTGARSDRR